ncbi:MAG: helix-hairpin-helix domain-containing protein [Synergistaceae bacterium]|nr:helix-hairpin-helix domain-containing protein [Synergistaceae bacterium]
MQSRRIIVSVAGVMLFLLAGGVAMFVLPSDSPNPSAKNQPASSAKTAQETPAPSTANLSPQESPNPPEPKVWYVYVTGEVQNQGLYAVSPDSRVFQAINAAGGFTRKADRASLNLAAHLVDETHIHVPAKGAKNSGTPSQANTPETIRIPGYSQAGTRTASGLIDINRADLQELQRISGVGPAIAQRIIDYRKTHGAFTSIDDLQKVKGIGQARLAQIRPQITLRGGGSSTKSQPSSQTSSGNTGLIDINHASQTELQRISGVGAAIAKRIIDYRNTHGSFSRAEDLLNVRGIGAAKLEQIRPQVVIR